MLIINIYFIKIKIIKRIPQYYRQLYLLNKFQSFIILIL